MITLLLVGGLTVAASDTALRVPGTPLRFGTPIERIVAFGEFAPPGAHGAHPGAGAPAAAPAGGVVLEGPSRFFGIDAVATLTFVDRRLARMKFVVDPVSPHSVDYIEDQLRRSRLRRECARDEPGARTCDWLGSTNLHLVLDQNKLMADLALVPRAAPPAPSPARADTVVADSMNARVAHADTLWLASGNDSLPPPVAVDSCKPVRPDSARSQGVFGRVTVDVLVDTDGRVIEANVVHGIAALNEAALDCARKFRFEPYHWRGRNVRFWHELPMTFLLD